MNSTLPKLLIVLIFGAMISCNESARKEEKPVPGPEKTKFSAKEEKQETTPEVQEESSTEGKLSADARLVADDEMVYKYDVSLPNSWKLYEIGEKSLDYGDYEVTLPNGYKILSINVLLNSRYDAQNIQELYDDALKLERLDISYKLQKDNWFVLSGIEKNTKNVFYWKRVFGEMYIGDLYFEYPKSKEAQITPHIGSIAKSFTCD